MASANLVAYNAATKETFTEDRLEEQLLQDDGPLQAIEQIKRFKVGKQAVTPIHTSRNGGYSVLPAGGGTLNTAGNQGMKRALWNYTNHHQQIAVEGETIDGTADDSIAVAQAVDTEVSGGLQDMRREIVRQIFLDGTSQICVCGVTTAATTLVLEPVSGFNAIERGWLFEGALIDVGTVANPTLRGTRTVTGLTESATAPTITVDSVITTAVTDQISYKGSRTAAGSFEMNGMRNLVSQSAIVGTLDPATLNTWKAANVDLNGGTVRPLTLPLMYAQQRKVKQRTGRGVDTVWTGYKQQENFYTLLQMQARFDGNPGSAGDVDTAKFAGMSLKAFADVQNEDMYFFQKAHLLLCASGKPYWQNAVAGGEILVWIQGTDSYGSKITYRIQLGTNRRNAFARLGDLA